MADLSVVIVSYNTRALLSRCLDALFTASTAYDIEVIVVDNGSSDGTQDMLSRDYPMVQVIANDDNRGFAAANNQGMERASASTIVLLNSDAFINARAVSEGIRILESEPRAGLAGVRLENEDGSFQAGSGSFPTLWDDISSSIGLDRLTPRRDRQQPMAGRVDWVQGACMFVRREAFDDVGGLDTHFFMYSEEVDWCWRFWQQGWEVWQVPEASVVHLGGGSSLSNDTGRRVALYRSRLSLRRRFGGPVPTAILWVAMVAGLMSRAGVRWIVELIVRHKIGGHSARADLDLLQAILRTDPLARQAVA